jgi:hypothetical protein
MPASTLHGFPYFEVQFTKEGEVFDSKEVRAGSQLLSHEGTTDLLVISHGWNNDMNNARSMYKTFFKRFREAFDNAPSDLKSRKYAVMAVLWPSKKFADEELIASGAASAGSAITEEAIKDQLRTLKEAVDDPEADKALDEAIALVDELEDRQEAREKFVDLIRSVLPESAATPEDASEQFFELPPEEVFGRLSTPVLPTGALPVGAGGASSSGGAAGGMGGLGPAGGAAGLGSFFGGIKAGALNLANYATYYKMKQRAGEVGSNGVYDTLRTFKSSFPNLRLHLIGHSFGGRLVTAAIAGPRSKPALMVNSLSLLQAAFSHYGFAKDYEGSADGLFRSVVLNRRVSGPIVITHTRNDKAVGLAYPIAARLSKVVASALGDKDSLYGGMGSNGAQKTPEAVDGSLLSATGTYSFTAGKIYNVRSDDFIADHSDICSKEVSHAVLSAIART